MADPLAWGLKVEFPLGPYKEELRIQYHCVCVCAYVCVCKMCTICPSNTLTALYVYLVSDCVLLSLPLSNGFVESVLNTSLFFFFCAIFFCFLSSNVGLYKICTNVNHNVIIFHTIVFMYHRYAERYTSSSLPDCCLGLFSLISFDCC